MLVFLNQEILFRECLLLLFSLKALMDVAYIQTCSLIAVSFCVCVCVCVYLYKHIFALGLYHIMSIVNSYEHIGK